MITPKVFISYSWSTPEHQTWVLELAEKLRSDGVDVILDQWDLKPGHDKHAYMEKMVTDKEISKVLVICDKIYKEKGDGRQGGVGTESTIISSKVYNKVSQENFIPLVREVDEKGNAYVPVFLESQIYLDFSKDDTYHSEYEKLLRDIYDKPKLQKPPIGAPPSYITEDEPNYLRTNHKFMAFKDAIKNDKKTTKGLAQDYLSAYLKVLSDFFIESEFSKEIDEEVIGKINRFKSYRDEFIEFIELICKYSSDNSYFEDIFEFIGKVISFIKNLYLPHPYANEQFKFILYELFLYLITILIENKRFAAVNIFLDDIYYYKNQDGNKSSDFSIFNAYLRSIDHHRKERLESKRISLTIDILKERCDKFSFDRLIQTDIILFLRLLLADQKTYWLPRTLVFLHWHEEPLELFFKAESKKHFNVIKELLKIKSKTELLTQYTHVKDNIHRYLDSYLQYDTPDFSILMNLDKLDTK